jgi:hypothetical protein
MPLTDVAVRNFKPGPKTVRLRAAFNCRKWMRKVAHLFVCILSCLFTGSKGETSHQATI